jgi:hypothetical protein
MFKAKNLPPMFPNSIIVGLDCSLVFSYADITDRILV